MSIPPSTFTAEARVLGLTGLAAWLLAGGCQVWEVLAAQSPDSPLHLGVLAGPIAQLRVHCFGLGTVCVGLALLWSLFRLERGRLLLGMFLGGAGIETLSLAWAASHGMLVVQAFDPRADARLVFYVRAFGHGLALLSLALFLWRGLRARRSQGG